MATALVLWVSCGADPTKISHECKKQQIIVATTSQFEPFEPRYLALRASGVGRLSRTISVESHNVVHERIGDYVLTSFSFA